MIAAPPPDDDKNRRAYDRRKTRSAGDQARQAAAGREIAPLPPIADPPRRLAAVASFQVFAETYFPAQFTLAWSPDHLKVIERIEQAVRHGGLFALAMPRGSGKTTLAETACIWATITAARPYVVLIGSTAARAQATLESIKIELETNATLAADFPEVCYPIHRLERINNRAAGQTYLGEPTRITWTQDKLVYPTIPGSPASGAILTAAGLTGGDVRGQKHKRADGSTARPSLVLLDDPQTTESANSLLQSERREALVAGDVLGMAGPGEKIAGLMACTVIAPGDMADNLLDRDKHPEWQGERTKMVYQFPQGKTAEKHWETYREILDDSLRNGGDKTRATEYYQANREEMDAGAQVAWPERFNDDEISALQHAQNLRFRNEAAFMAECQNEPIHEADGADMLTAEAIAAKVSGHKRGSIPAETSHLVAFADVQKNALYYVVAAVADDFTSYVVDYGTWPDQRRAYFALSNIRRTIGRKFPRAGLEGSILAALEALAGEIMPKVWHRDDGTEAHIDRLLVDANWGESTDVVYQFAQTSEFAGRITPSHGQYLGASSKPYSEYKRHPGDRVGHFWRMPAVKGRRAVRYVTYDTNYWKSFTHARLAVARGDRGCLSLFGEQGKRTDHRQISEHLTAEYPVKTAGRGRTVDEWKLRPNRDNHWLDCLVGCMLTACMVGAALPTWTDTHRRRARRRPKFRALQT